MRLRLVHPVRHNDRTVAGQKRIGAMHLDDAPNEAVEVLAYPFAIDGVLNELDTGATDDLRDFAFPEFFERRRIVGTLALQVFCRKLILRVVSVFRDRSEEELDLLGRPVQ